MKKAFITGINGQTGSYLAESLLEKGYLVHGMIRRSSLINTARIDHIFEHKNLNLHYGDITDSNNINNLIGKIKPDEIYNLAAMSHVQISFELPYYTSQVDAIGTLNVLEAVKNNSPESKILQASTSELFGKVQEVPQKETTPFYPRSPYGVAKLYGYWIVKNYREAYNMYALNSICFNHSSPRRTHNFILRKITMGLTNIYKGNQDVLLLGNLNSKRDIGFAGDYAEAMILMLQQEKPDDFVIATGETFSIRELVNKVSNELGIIIKWEGEGENEIGINIKNGKTIIKVNKRYFRPAEVDLLIGDSSKARTKLGWKPKTNIDSLIRMMVKEDLNQ